MPQGFAALLCLDPDGDLEETVEEMNTAVAEVATGEITLATRSVTLDDVAVNEGEYIGLVNGRLCASGGEMTAVFAQVLSAMEMDERELLTIYYGSGVSAEQAREIATQINDLYEDVEIEIMPGGQPHYFYILGAE